MVLSVIERIVYDAVKQRPAAKAWIRDAYQRLLDVVPGPRTASAYPIVVRKGFFFGFHDKCPWSVDGAKLLAHRALVPLRMPIAEDEVEIGYFVAQDTTRFEAIALTRAWNWHQGAMLQWLGDCEHIVFNDFDGHKHVARIVETSGREVRRLPVPVAAVSLDGTLGATYDFARLRGTVHGYGYANGVDSAATELTPCREGIGVIDMTLGTTRLLMTVSEAASMCPEPSMRGAYHYVSHARFSGSRRRLAFFHRWVAPGGLQRTRMMSCDTAGGRVHVFPTDGMVSHFDWAGEAKILAYARTKRWGDRYHLLTDGGGDATVVGEGVLTSDGHPSVSREGRWILTDTYPDRYRLRRLILYDLHEGRGYVLAKLYSPREFSDRRYSGLLRCDLHPRWSRDERVVCFDSAHTGARALCTLEIGDLGGGGPSRCLEELG